MLKQNLKIFLLSALGAAVFCGGASAEDLTARVRLAIEQQISAHQPAPSLILGEKVLALQTALPQFYAAREYRPAWLDGRGLKKEGLALVDTLRGAAEEGLCPEDYHLVYLESLIRLFEDYRKFDLPPDPAWLTQFDILLSDALFGYASHLIQGRVDPAEVHEGWRANPRKADLSKLLRYALENDRLATVLADLVPPHAGYLRLKSALERLRVLSAMGGWKEVPAGPMLRPGMSDPRLPMLRQRLWAGGDLVPPVDWSEPGSPDAVDEIFAALVDGQTAPQSESVALVDVADPRYDPVTVAAMRRFQRRHGLSPDGVLGPKTLAELNTSVEARIRQVELNLERWRWLPKSLGKTHLLVNSADFRLEVVEEDKTVLTMPVVVGTGYRKTPVFSAHMTYLEFAPYWFVPPTILREDKLPIIRSNPGWLRRHHYEIVPWGADAAETIDPREIDWRTMRAEKFPGVLRMQPGPWNPLGRVKFMFPNRYSVYLHDTPDRHLFNRNVRSFSSGCIRIERPLDLAQYLLENEGWGCDALIDKMNGATPSRVELRRPVPVHILYWTAWVDEGGTVNFRDDLYQRDLDLDLALFGSRDDGGEEPDSAGGMLAEKKAGN